jgi:plastocyanin
MAQITIDNTNFASIGDTIYLASSDFESVEMIDINLGNPGYQIWDFTNLEDENVEEIIFLDPQSTTYSSNFPEATHAINAEDEGEEYLMYIMNTSDYAATLGFVYEDMIFEAMDVFINWPLNYEDYSEFELEIDSTYQNEDLSSGIDSIRIKNVKTSYKLVDAWGDILLPIGEFNSLRIKNTEIEVDSIWNKTIPIPESDTILATDYMAFSPSTLTINVGDTIYFTNLTSHNAVEVSEETWNINENNSNGGFSYQTDDYHIFTEAGTYFYVCTPHVGMGMKGSINVIENDNEWVFEYSDEPSYTSYEWWSNDENAGYPIVHIEVDDNGEITEYEFVTNNETTLINDFKKDFTIFPNPSNGIFHLNTSFSSNLDVHICVINSIGQIIHKLDINTNQKIIIDLSDQSHGIYLLSVKSENSVSHHNLLIK